MRFPNWHARSLDPATDAENWYDDPEEIQDRPCRLYVTMTDEELAYAARTGDDTALVIGLVRLLEAGTANLQTIMLRRPCMPCYARNEDTLPDGKFIARFTDSSDSGEWGGAYAFRDTARGALVAMLEVHAGLKTPARIVHKRSVAEVAASIAIEGARNLRDAAAR